MKIQEIITALESLAHPSLQEQYDNAGLLTGHAEWECNGIICSLDVTEEVVKEAISKNCNMIVAHHPIIFGGLKKINGKNYIEKSVIAAIKNDIAIYAVHTNLDNVTGGVNGKIAKMLGLENCSILSPRENLLRKFITFVPAEKAGRVRDAIFSAGGGFIGNYSECSFNTRGTGTFKANENANPYVGKINEQHEENEVKIEVIFEAFRERAIITAMKAAHPYEEVAYDILPLVNQHPFVGSGIIGELSLPLPEEQFLTELKKIFKVSAIRHTAFLNKKIKKVALCGGAGSFLIFKALSLGADVYITADMKYHEFFDANDEMLIADIGHYESEQFTIDLLQEFLEKKFHTFAVLKTAVNTNPVHYC